MFVYLHGFNSSPQSFKARALAQRLAERDCGDDFVAPALSHWPSEAIATAEAVIDRHDARDVTLIGSSLGGHYATWLAERYGVRAVLVNPAIRPADLLATELGAQRNLHSGAQYELTAAHLEQLRALDVDAITRPERYLLVIATEDEVLDSRVAMARFALARRIVHTGGDHGFAELTRYLDAVIDFGLE
ncbi:MAG: YqiA/YcfP family alpha/beta fold hydrolase [Burkholderiales bacterium]